MLLGDDHLGGAGEGEGVSTQDRDSDGVRIFDGHLNDVTGRIGA